MQKKKLQETLKIPEILKTVELSLGRNDNNPNI